MKEEAKQEKKNHKTKEKREMSKAEENENKGMEEDGS